MRPQGPGRVEPPRQLRLDQRGVDLIVADLVDQFARNLGVALQLGGQLMFGLYDIRQDRSKAKGTDRIDHFLARENDIFCPASASDGPVQA